MEDGVDKRGRHATIGESRMGAEDIFGGRGNFFLLPLVVRIC